MRNDNCEKTKGRRRTKKNSSSRSPERSARPYTYTCVYAPKTSRARHRAAELRFLPSFFLSFFPSFFPTFFSLSSSTFFSRVSALRRRFTEIPAASIYRVFLQRVYQNDYENDERYCQANYDEHQFLRTEYKMAVTHDDERGRTHPRSVRPRERRREKNSLAPNASEKPTIPDREESRGLVS